MIGKQQVLQDQLLRSWRFGLSEKWLNANRAHITKEDDTKFHEATSNPKSMNSPVEYDSV